MKSSFLTSLGLSGITNYPFGKAPTELKGEEKTRLDTEWKDQTTTEKVVTALTLPFRAVKRVVVAQKAISAGVVVGGVFGVVGASYAGYMGWMFAGSILGGIVLGGLIGWGTAALFFSNKKDETKTTTVKPATVTTVDAATGTTIVSTPASVAAPEAPKAAATTPAAAPAATQAAA